MLNKTRQNIFDYENFHKIGNKCIKLKCNIKNLIIKKNKLFTIIYLKIHQNIFYNLYIL